MDGPDRAATSRSDIVVDVRGVWKRYQQRQRSTRLADLARDLLRPTVRIVEALRGVDLMVHRGEIVAYAGPNGAGKSTTVKLLASLLAPDAGTVRVLGMDPIRDRVRYVGRIAVVFGQRTELWWDHPVRATFEWKRVVWRVPDERYHRMLATVCELLGLDELLGTYARELSLGQRMRADLGLALLHEPEVIFLDEATLGLDVLAKRSILDFVKLINRERRVTVVVTSHDMAELEQLAGRIVLIHRGSIAFDGDFARLRQTFGDRRRLALEMSPGPAPRLEGATLISSDPTTGRHELTFDAATTRLPDLLRQAAEQATVYDVETHRAAIEEVIADVYRQWLGQPPDPG